MDADNHAEGMYQLIIEALGAMFLLCSKDLSSEQCFEQVKWCLTQLKMPTNNIVDVMKQVEVLSSQEQGAIAHSFTCIVSGGDLNGDPGMDIKVAMRPSTGMSLLHCLVVKLHLQCPNPVFVVRQDYILAEYVLSWDGWATVAHDEDEGKYVEMTTLYQQIIECELDDPTTDIITRLSEVLQILGDTLGENMDDIGTDVNGPDNDEREPLPEGWTLTLDPTTGTHYYQNVDMGLSTWDLDEIPQLVASAADELGSDGGGGEGKNEDGQPGSDDDMVADPPVDDEEDGPLPDGWEAVVSDDGQTYYQNLDEQKSVWNKGDIPGYGEVN